MLNPKVILKVSTLGFVAFGAWALLAPQGMLGFVDVDLASAAARTEARAYYGGLELGFAAFLWISSGRPAWWTPALAAAASIYAGCASVRLASMAWERTAGWPLALSALGELCGAVGTAYLVDRGAPSP